MSSIITWMIICSVCLTINDAVNHWELTADGTIQPQVCECENLKKQNKKCHSISQL